MANCIFFGKTTASGAIQPATCWKTSFTLASSGFDLWVSGNCTPCLTAMQLGGYNANRIAVMQNATELISGARVQFTY